MYQRHHFHLLFSSGLSCLQLRSELKLSTALARDPWSVGTIWCTIGVGGVLDVPTVGPALRLLADVTGPPTARGIHHSVLYFILVGVFETTGRGI